MSRRAELSRHAFNFALIKSATDGIKINFHNVKGSFNDLRFHHYKIIKDNIHAGMSECASQQSNIAVFQVWIVNLSH